MNRVQVGDPFLKFAPGKFSVGRFEGMLFPLAAIFLDPIIPPADLMPIKTRIFWDLDQRMSGVLIYSCPNEGWW